jgi:hypothetical protein
MPLAALAENKRMSVDDRFFVHTNVLLYSVDPLDRGKQRSATRWLAVLWEDGSGSLSWQVLRRLETHGC